MKRYKWFFVILSLCFLFPMTCLADFGPKPTLKIIVRNAPEEVYYLDLLIESDTFDENFDIGSYNPDMVNNLLTFKEDGWYPVFICDLYTPMNGKLTGSPNHDWMIHTFSYRVPDVFKIIIVTKSGTVQVSETFVRTTLSTTLSYNFETNTIYEKPKLGETGRQYFSTCLPTLLIEGIILILFKFSMSKNLKVFLIVNCMTQLFLTAGLNYLLLMFGLTGILIQLPFEIVIVMIEAIVYGFMLKEHSVKRRILYALSANTISWLCSILLMFLNSLII